MSHAKARYRNSFHNPLDASYGPEFYETDVKPTSYKGFTIYRRQTSCFDCVLDLNNEATVIGMYAGLSGAKSYINGFWERQNMADDVEEIEPQRGRFSPASSQHTATTTGTRWKGY